MLTLKKIDLNNSLSKETLCFSAEVYWDGRFIGMAENRGHGGGTWVRNFGERKNPTADADLAAAEAWSKDQPMLDEYGDQLLITESPEFHDLPSYVDYMVAEWDIRRKFKRSLTRSFKAETWFETVEGSVRVIKRPCSVEVAKYVSERYPGAVILNELPIEEVITKRIKSHQDAMKAERDKKRSN